LLSEIARLLPNYVKTDSDPIAALLAPKASRGWDHRLQQDLRTELGLETRVVLHLEEDSGRWVEKLRAEPARQYPNVKFRPFNATRNFLLTFSLRVPDISIKHWSAVRRRARVNLAPKAELDVIQDRIKQLIDPIVVNFPPNVLQCTHDGFWQCLGVNLRNCVQPLIAEEFGCLIDISGMKRERNPYEEQRYAQEDPEALKRIKHLYDQLDKARTRHLVALERTDVDLQDEEVKRAARNVKELEKAYDSAKATVDEKSLLGSRPGVPNTQSMIDMLTDTIRQACHVLGLPPGKADTQLLLGPGSAASKPAAGPSSST
jgi:hypothetical protein